MLEIKMKMFTKLVVFLALFQASLTNKTINKLFDKVNNETKQFNEIAAEIAYDTYVDPEDRKLMDRIANYQKKRIMWHHETCDQLETMQFHHKLNKSQDRQTYLLCKGFKFSYNEAREYSRLLTRLQAMYSETEICLPGTDMVDQDDLAKVELLVWKYVLQSKEDMQAGEVNYGVTFGSNLCLIDEKDVEKLMRYSKNEEVLRWVWSAWRERTKSMLEPFHKLSYVMNSAAARNGYPNAAEVWQDEVEIPNIEEYCTQLYAQVEPLYKMLHGVVRFFLRKEYGDIVPKKGPIPAHLLGGLWANNWERLIEMIMFQFNKKPIDLNKEIKTAKVNWTVPYMVKRAEDFYMSLGLPAMTEKFWRESIFSRENHTDARCHPVAADMFKDGDFRLMYCTEVSFDDFYVLHHEMGHIQYYMAYEKQPAIFREGNAAFQESVGEAIMLGVMTPQHLYRLGLIDDALLYPKNDLNPENIEVSMDEDDDLVYNFTKDNVSEDDELELSADDIFLLQQGLSKIPQIPFALVMDGYRWKYFEERLDKGDVNKEFWMMVERLQGVAPPEPRSERYFDAGAKLHVVDNIPYMRYFLSSFLQYQLFEDLCKASVFGRRDVYEPIPKSVAINRCDIYGSKAAGKILRDIMSRGNSQHWRDILGAATGNTNISAEPFKRYYRPLYKLLNRLVHKLDIPIGW